MLKYVIYTFILHIPDMFNKISVMASRGPFNSLLK